MKRVARTGAPLAALVLPIALAVLLSGCFAPAGCAAAQPLSVTLANQTNGSIQASVRLAELAGAVVSEEVIPVTANDRATVANLETRAGVYNLTVTVGPLTATSEVRVEPCYFQVLVGITATEITIAQAVS